MAANLSFDELVRLGFDQVRRDGASRPSFSVRLLELLAELRSCGGETAASSAEVSRQAELVRAGASALADVDADARFVDEAYERLHGARSRQVAELARALSGGDGDADGTGGASVTGPAAEARAGRARRTEAAW